MQIAHTQSLQCEAMPIRPRRLCKHTGCQRLAGDNGYCDRHKAQQSQKNKAIHNLYDADWRRESKAFLAEHPWCAECLKHDVYTPATVVDHIKPHRGDKKLFWDRNNWQSMCKHHHDQKTARGE